MRKRRSVPPWLHLLARDELVHVVEAFVVAAVGHNGVVVGDVDVGGLVAEPAHRGVFHRSRVRVPRIDLDDVAEAVGFIGRLTHIKARVEGLPQQFGRLQRNPVAVVAVGVHRVGLRRAFDRAEVLLEILLAGEHCAPRGYAARTVGEGAGNRATFRVGGRLDEVCACRGPDERHRGVGGDAPVVSPHHGFEAAAGHPFDLDDTHADRGDLDVELLAGRRVLLVAGEHEHRRDVLVVGDKKEPVGLAVYREQTREVVVEAELTPLRGTGLVADIELRRTVENRVAPTDHDALLVTLGDDDGVLAVGRDGVELHARGCFGRRLRRRGRGRCGLFALSACGQHRTCADRQHRDPAGLQYRAPRHLFGDIAEVLVVAGVADRLGAGVAALVTARHMLPPGLSVMGDEEVQRHECHGRGSFHTNTGRGCRPYAPKPTTAGLAAGNQKVNSRPTPDLPIRQVRLPSTDRVGTLATWPSANSTDHSGSTGG